MGPMKLNSKEWSSLRERVLLKIDNFFDDLNDIKSGIDSQNMKKIVFNYLSNEIKEFNSLSDEDYAYFASSIFAIYLLKTGDYSSQNEIVRKSGFSGRWHIETIREILKLNLKESVHAKLYIDNINKVRECSRCYIILSFDEFSGRSRRCNPCRNIENMINYYQKKVAVALFVTLKQRQKIYVDDFLRLIRAGQRFDSYIICEDCGLGAEFLPALEFHHPCSKEGHWDKLRSRPLKFILETAKRENWKIICSNCHKIMHADKFNKHKNDILSNTMDKIVRDRALERLIHKRKILDELFSDGCSHCGLTDNNFLPAMQFHHPDLRTIGWHELRNYKEIEFIKKKLVKEMCIALCSNCHRIEEATLFNEHKDEILSKYLNNY